MALTIQSKSPIDPNLVQFIDALNEGKSAFNMLSREAWWNFTLFPGLYLAAIVIIKAVMNISLNDQA